MMKLWELQTIERVLFICRLFAILLAGNVCSDVVSYRNLLRSDCFKVRVTGRFQRYAFGMCVELNRHIYIGRLKRAWVRFIVIEVL